MKHRLPLVAGAIFLVGLVAFLVSQYSQDHSADALQTGAASDLEVLEDAVVARRQAANAVSEENEEVTEEQTAAPTLVPAQRTVKLLIFEAEHEPAFPADVIICQDGKYCFTGKTDRKGLVQCDLAQGSAAILVWTPGAVVARATIAADVSEQEIVLPEGEEISGSLLVDGVLPKEPLALSMTLFGNLRKDILNGLPSNIRPVLPEGIQRFTQAKIMVGLDGKFRFRRIPPVTSEGHFFLASEYAFVISSKLSFFRSFSLSEKNIRLNVTTLPVLTGVVVEKQSGEAAVGVEVEVVFPIDGTPGYPRRASIQTNKAGRFRLGIGAHEAEEATLNLSYRGARKVMQLKGPFEPVRELGTLVVGGSRELTFQVVDKAGTGLDKSIVLVPRKSIQSTSVGRDGLQTIKGVSYDVTAVEVGSLGYEPVMFPIDDSAQSPIRVALRKSNKLTVRVLDPSGKQMKNQTVVLSWEKGKGPFLIGKGSPCESLKELGTSRPSSWSGHRDGGGKAEFPMAKKSHLEFYALDPQVSIKIYVTGTFGNSVKEIGPFQLARGEIRVVDLVIEENEKRDLKFRVLDENGGPIAKAWVRISHPKLGRGVGLSADAKGEVIHKGIDIDRANLEIGKAGFRGISLDDHELRRDGAFEVIRLDRGIDLTVKVLDHRGDLRDARVGSHYNGGTNMARKQEDGTYLLEHQAERDVEVFVRIGHQRISKSVHPIDGAVTFQVPELGALEVAWEVALKTEFPRLKMALLNKTESPLGVGLRKKSKNSQSIIGLLPGDYECWIEDYNDSKDNRGWFDATERKKITIVAGKKAVLHF